MVALLIVVVIIALVLQYFTVRKGLKGLEVTHSVSKAAVEPEEEIELILTFVNHSRFFLPYIGYEEVLPEGISLISEGPGLFPKKRDGKAAITGSTWLKPNQTLEKRFKISADARGRYMLFTIKAYGGDFLGLKEDAHAFDSFVEIVAFPKKTDDRQVNEVLGGFMGEMSVNRFMFEDPILTLGYREYTGTEPLKMVSWTQSARSQQLMVKKYDYTLEPSISVVLNVDEEGKSDEDTEKSFCLARAVCAALEDKGIQYDFRMNAIASGSISDWSYVTEGLGRQHYFGILEGLGRALLNNNISCAELVRRAVMHTGSSKGVIFITPGTEAGAVNTAGKVAAQSGNEILILKAREEIL